MLLNFLKLSGQKKTCRIADSQDAISGVLWLLVSEEMNCEVAKSSVLVFLYGTCASTFGAYASTSGYTNAAAPEFSREQLKQ